ncbi:hypothetical protein ARSEF4850_008106 [Beauveria asiatica]
MSIVAQRRSDMTSRLTREAVGKIPMLQSSCSEQLLRAVAQSSSLARRRRRRTWATALMPHSLKYPGADRFHNSCRQIKDASQLIFETNLFGVIHGVNTFLPVVQEASKTKRTAIVITGSKQGITNPPANPAYNASKSAVKTLAEHLSWHLRETATSVHLLVPGWTFTGMTGGGQTKEKPAGAWAPEQVADFLYHKMEKSKFHVICPDNDVSEETDKKRMLWGVGDIVHGRPPLSRWRDEWKQEAEETMSETKM